jgi:hypothetical protein
MIQYDIQNVRDLFGSKVSIQSTKQNPICYIAADLKEATVSPLQ